jgi:voltage-gated potassium channel
MSESQSGNHERIGVFQIFILVLSVVVRCGIGADTFLTPSKEVSDILQTLDTLVCVILLTDFVVRLWRAESKLAFLKWG